MKEDVGMLPRGRLNLIMGRTDCNQTGGPVDSNCDDDLTRIKNELDSLRFTAKKQKMVLLACKQFFEQLQEKGLTLSFTERTVVGLLLEKIKGFE